MERLLRENENRGKTPEQQIREGITWEPIEEGKALARKSTGGSQHTEIFPYAEKGEVRNDLTSAKTFAEVEEGRVTDIIADRVGLGTGVTYEKG